LFHKWTVTTALSGIVGRENVIDLAGLGKGCPKMSEERLQRIRGDETSAGAACELGLDLGELQREAMKLVAARLFRIGQSRSRPLGSLDKLPAVDGPVAKSQTRDRVRWLLVHEGACFLAETAGKLSGSVMPSLPTMS
jgi:hypothetical protein